MKSKWIKIYSRQCASTQRNIHVFNLSRDAWIIFPACLVMYTLCQREQNGDEEEEEDEEVGGERGTMTFALHKYVKTRKLTTSNKFGGQTLNWNAKNEERSETALAATEKQQFSHINSFSFFFSILVSRHVTSCRIIIYVSWNSVRNSRLWIKNCVSFHFFWAAASCENASEPRTKEVFLCNLQLRFVAESHQQRLRRRQLCSNPAISNVLRV